MEALARYKAWVRANSAALSAVEGGISSLTWLLPDRFSGSELLLEAVHSALGFVSLCHETILAQPPAGAQPAPLPWPFWLGALQQIEVLVEIGASRLEARGRLNKYTALAALEAAKAALRVLILHSSRARLLLDGGATPPPAADAIAPDASIQAICKALAGFYRRHCFPEQQQQQQRDGKALAGAGKGSSAAGSSGSLGALSSQGSAGSPGQAYWWQRSGAAAGRAGGSCEAERQAQLAHLERQAAWRQGGLELLAAGELAHVFRPLLYALALRRWGVRSWKPWLLSLAVEAGAAGLTAAASRRSAAAQAGKRAMARTLSLGSLQEWQAFRWTAEEQRELTRRKLMFLFYLLRSPFFDSFTRRGVAAGQAVARPIPLVGSLVEKAVEILLGIQQHYTYTSAS